MARILQLNEAPQIPARCQLNRREVCGRLDRSSHPYVRLSVFVDQFRFRRAMSRCDRVALKRLETSSATRLRMSSPSASSLSAKSLRTSFKISVGVRSCRCHASAPVSNADTSMSHASSGSLSTVQRASWCSRAADRPTRAVAFQKLNCLVEYRQTSRIDRRPGGFPATRPAEPHAADNRVVTARTHGSGS